MGFHRWDDFPRKENPRKGNSGEVVSTENVLVKRGRIQAGTQFSGSLHRHPHDQFMVMLEGKMGMRIGDEDGWVEPGGFAAVPGNVFHGVTGVGPEGAVYLEILAPGRLEYLPGYVGPDKNEYRSP
ncbi:cupin domain-containing protein [Nitrospinota bacterium]